MTKSSYIIELILIGITIILTFFLFSLLSPVIAGIVILSTIIGLFAGKYLLSGLYIFIHRKIIGKGTIYTIERKKTPELYKNPSRVIYISLMALSLSLLISTNEIIYNVVSNIIATIIPGADLTPLSLKINVLMFAISFSSGIAMFLFTPGWLLHNSGLIHSNKEKDKDKKVRTEVKSVGEWFLSYFKGFAGIAGLISLFNFGAELYSADPSTVLRNALSFLIFPILVMIYTFPAIAILDKMVDKNEDYILKLCEKKGIKET